MIKLGQEDKKKQINLFLQKNYILFFQHQYQGCQSLTGPIEAHKCLHHLYFFASVRANPT
jgi:hypothetical protein